MTWKMSLLVICEIVGLFLNTMTADDKYSLRNREDSPELMPMELLQKQMTFSYFFSAFLKST